MRTWFSEISARGACSVFSSSRADLFRFRYENVVFLVFGRGTAEQGGGEEGGVLECWRMSSEKSGVLSDAGGEEGGTDGGIASLLLEHNSSSYTTPLSFIRIRFRRRSTLRLVESRDGLRVYVLMIPL